MKLKKFLLILIFILSLCLTGCQYLNIKTKTTTASPNAATTKSIITTLEDSTAKEETTAKGDDTPSGITTASPGITTEAPADTTTVPVTDTIETDTTYTTTLHAHEYVKEVTKEASCTEKGIITYTCTCGETYTEEIPLLDHTVVIDEGMNASCTSEGLTEGSHCSVCGTVIVKQEVIPMTDHTYELTSSVSADCVNTGKNVYTCRLCGNVKEESIKALGHDYVALSDNVEATCYSDGYISKKCSRCNDIIKETVECTGHKFVNGYCTGCSIPYIPYLIDTYGNYIDLYTNSDTNPYGIDLDKYGSDCIVMFYTPVLGSDPYASTNTTDFYKNYKVATTYEDAYYRTYHKLMSGDISDAGLNYYPSQTNSKKSGNSYVRNTTAVYILSTTGEYLAYVPNSSTMDRAIFYGGAYISMNDVAAYLLAFGEVPANEKYTSGQKSGCISDWGIYGRCNNTAFSGNTTSYPYEPELPYILSNSTVFVGNTRTYYETDFGALGGFESEAGNITTDYNTGSSINRNVCRFVFVCDSDITSIDERYVFYTYNHYNDFQEYLNYDNAWGLRFGNCTGGGTYSSKTDYSPTQYPSTVLSSLYPSFDKQLVHSTDKKTTGGESETEVTSLEATIIYSKSTTTNMTGSNDASVLGADDAIFTITGDKGSNANYPGLNKAGQIRLYASNTNGNTITISVSDDYIIDSVTINFGTTVSDITINSGETITPTASKSYSMNINGSSVAIKNVGSSQCYILSIVITYHKK